MIEKQLKYKTMNNLETELELSKNYLSTLSIDKLKELQKAHEMILDNMISSETFEKDFMYDYTVARIEMIKNLLK